MLTDLGNGRVRFELYWPHASRVDLDGNFAGRGHGGRRTVPMRCGSRGWWSAEMVLPPGRHTYRYMVNGCYGVPDYGAGDAVYDATGNLVTRVVVGTGLQGKPVLTRGRAAVPRRSADARSIDAVNEFSPRAR
jgi:hypothetical protein